MEKKVYKLGILVGRFQTIHSGHEMMINKAVELCENVGVFVGSSQESRTDKNPFSYEERELMLKKIFSDAISVYPLPDIGVGNVSKWGDYVLQNVLNRFGTMPDLLITGKERRRIEWFGGENGNQISELYIPKTIAISSTDMREYFIKDDFESWKQYTNPRLWDMYDTLKQIVISSKDNHDTKSI